MVVANSWLSWGLWTQLCNLWVLHHNPAFDSQCLERGVLYKQSWCTRWMGTFGWQTDWSTGSSSKLHPWGDKDALDADNWLRWQKLWTSCWGRSTGLHFARPLVWQIHNKFIGDLFSRWQWFWSIGMTVVAAAPHAGYTLWSSDTMRQWMWRGIRLVSDCWCSRAPSWAMSFHFGLTATVLSNALVFPPCGATWLCRHKRLLWWGYTEVFFSALAQSCNQLELYVAIKQWRWLHCAFWAWTFFLF